MDRSGALDALRHVLVIGGNFLAAVLVVELSAIVVGMVVGSGDVQASRGAVVADRERQLRCRDVILEVIGRQVDADPIARVHLGGQPREVARGLAEHRVRKLGVVEAAQVVESAHVVDDHDRKIRAGQRLAQIVDVALDRARQRGCVVAIRADADRAATAPGPEGQDAIEAVEEQRPALTCNQPLELRAVVRLLVEPLLEVRDRHPLVRVRQGQRREAVGYAGEKNLSRLRSGRHRGLISRPRPQLAGTRRVR